MILSILRSKRFAKKVFILLSLIIIPAFVFWGVGSVSNKAPVIGSISGKKITADEFAKSRQGIKVQVLMTYYFNGEILNTIINNRPLINQMAWERMIFLDAARAKKVKVTDQDVRSFVSNHPMFNRSGAFDNEVYAYALKNMLSMEPRQFEELIRENLEVRLYRQALLKNVKIEDQEVLDQYRKATDNVAISYVFFDQGDYSALVTASENEIKEFYEKNKSLFLAPEKVTADYIEIKYDTALEEMNAREKLKTIYPDVSASPDSMKKIAVENGARYGSTGPFSKEEAIPGVIFAKEMNEAVFSLPKGEITEPIFTAPSKGAVYILHKTGEVPPKQLTLEEVHDTIAKEITFAKSMKEAHDVAQRLYEEGADKGASFQDAAFVAKKEVLKATLNADGYIDKVGPAKVVVVRAIEVGENKLIPPMPTQNGILLVHVDKIIPADMAAFESKKAEIADNLLAMKQMDVIDKWLKDKSPQVKLLKPLDQI